MKDMPKLSDVFGGKVPGLNAPLKFSEAVPNVEKVVPKGKTFEDTGWLRLGQQKNLNLWGDSDKDKIKNILDCDPLNPQRQGVLSKTKNWVSGKGFVEDDEVKIDGTVLKTYDETPSEVQTTLHPNFVLGGGVKEPVQPQFSQRLQSLFGRVTKGVATVGVAGGKAVGGMVKGYKEGKEQKRAREKEIKDLKGEIQKAAYAEAVKEATKKKIRDQTESEMEKYGFAARREEYPGPMGRLVRPQYRHPTQGILPSQVRGGLSDITGGMSAGFRTLQQGVVAGGVAPFSDYGQKINYFMGIRSTPGSVAQTTQTAMGQVGTQQSFAQKVDELMNQGKRSQELASPRRIQPVSQQAVVQQPRYAPAAQPQTYAPAVQPQPRGSPPPGKPFWSEASKSWVEYQRGPYKKRPTQHYQQQGYPQQY